MEVSPMEGNKKNASLAFNYNQQTRKIICLWLCLGCLVILLANIFSFDLAYRNQQPAKLDENLNPICGKTEQLANNLANQCLSHRFNQDSSFLRLTNCTINSQVGDFDIWRVLCLSGGYQLVNLYTDEMICPLHTNGYDWTGSHLGTSRSCLSYFRYPFDYSVPWVLEFFEKRWDDERICASVPAITESSEVTCECCGKYKDLFVQLVDVPIIGWQKDAIGSLFSKDALSSSLTRWRALNKKIVDASLLKPMPGHPLIQSPVAFHNAWPTMHEHVHILSVLRDALPKSQQIYLEIGTFRGMSSLFMATHHYNTKVIAIDLCYYKGQEEEIRWNFKNIFPNIDVTLIKNTSRNSFEILNKKMINSIGIVFIDGDHSYDMAKEDIYSFSQFVKPGGFLVIDDFGCHSTYLGPKIAVFEFIQEMGDNWIVIGTIENVARARCCTYAEIYGSPSFSPFMSNVFILKKKS